MPPKRKAGYTPGGPSKAQSSKRARFAPLGGHQGIFFTSTRGKEERAASDLLSLLHRVVEEVYPNSANDANDAEADLTEEKQEQKGDEAEELERELAALRAEKAQAIQGKRTGLEVLPLSGIECVGFISVRPGWDPSVLAKKVLRQALETGVSHSRYLLRLTPVYGTCRAERKAVEQVAREACRAYSGTSRNDGDPVTFKIEPRVRTQAPLQRDELIATVGENVPSGWRAQLSNPHVWILVETARAYVSIGLLDDFDQLGKYNLQTCADWGQKRKAQQAG